MKQRIYKYDNVKAFLIFLVVIGHMTSDYVSDSHMVRWITLWIYTFHMPAFIFVSGLMHKHYVTEERAALGVKGETRLRWDKVAGFFLCAYALKGFLQVSRTLMGQHPVWSWIDEGGIPWYLFVMAEYELLFYVMRYIDGGADTRRGIPGAAVSGTTDGNEGAGRQAINTRPLVVILGAFALSAVIGYFPAVDDTFCLSRMINFLPIYMIGYYLDMKKLLPLLRGEKYGGSADAGDTAGSGQGTTVTGGLSAAEQLKIRARRRAIVIFSWLTIIVTLAVCYFGKWGMYSWRKWFTGRRSYEYLQHFFSYAVKDGWWIRICVWAVALAIVFALLALMPDKNLGFITTIGARTLSVYFWHRPLCYLFRTWKVLPRLCVLFGGTYNDAVAGVRKGFAFGGSTWSMLAAFIVYILIGAAMTALFSLEVFEHPTSDLMKLGAKFDELIHKNNKTESAAKA